ncbi:MAG: glycoside hydrolase family 99-like domain-containing protein [Pseudoxanthomonas sp.]
MNNFKSTIGWLIQRTYLALPIGWKHRLALKHWLFHNLPSIFGRTNAYQRWRYFGGRARSPIVWPSDPVSVVKEQVAIATPAQTRFLDDLYARSVGQHGEAYVPLAGEAGPIALKAKAIAFYLPQFHPIAENNEWWGRGFTEWTNVSRAMPQYVGHDQPHLPGELGFYDLRLVDNMRRQAELARLYGVHGFCFHHYWFSGRRLLERPIDQLIAHPDIDLPFCLCWANENWTRRWDGHDEDVLLGQRYTPEDDLAFIVDLLPYLRDSRYIKIDGRPLIIVYRPSLLPDCSRTLQIWRERCREEGIGEIFLAMVQFDIDDPNTLGFDAAIEFPPHKLARGLPCINERMEIINPEYAGYIVDYQDLVASGKNWPEPAYPLFKGVAPRWDNEARKPGRGYTFAGSTPEHYGGWLQSAITYARSHPVSGESIVFINAWNEWAEGAHLEPDRKYGYAYLQATRDALDAGQTPTRILVVSHDAHPHGAQYLALNLVRELIHGLKLEVEVMLQGPGQLTTDFEALAPVHKLDGEGDSALFAALRKRGFDMVLANTAVSGRIAAELHRAGFKLVTLVHELPGVIEQYGLQSAVVDLACHSEKVVAGSVAVQAGLDSYLDVEQARNVVVKSQGLFTRSRYRGMTDLGVPREKLRKRLNLAADTQVVLAVGYADRRKGVDLLAAAAVIGCDVNDKLHFVWVGHRDVAMEGEVDKILRGTAAEHRFHFVGLDFDTDDYYAGADVYALASREDPFPSVILESLSVGTPVVAFSGTGGGADLLVTNTCGVVVPALDVEAYARAIETLLGDPAKRLELGDAGRSLVERDFSFRQYAIDLLRMLGAPMARVSVIVPNYNYAQYLRDRLASVSAQTWPLYEIIVLDDCSTDNSLECMQQLRGELNPEPRVVENPQNSGSVFLQWLKGVELASGDYVWIAEADDLSKPDFVERLVTVMERDDEILLGYCQSEQMDAYGQLLASDYLSYTKELSPDRWSRAYVSNGADEVEAGMAVKNTIPNVSSVLFRKDALLSVLRENINEISSYKIAGDWLVYLHLMRKGKVCFVPESLNRHRRHATSVTIGSAAELHFGEISRLQSEAARCFQLSPRTHELAREYLDSLKIHFDLSGEPGAGT